MDRTPPLASKVDLPGCQRFRRPAACWTRIVGCLAPRLQRRGCIQDSPAPRTVTPLPLVGSALPMSAHPGPEMSAWSIAQDHDPFARRTTPRPCATPCNDIESPVQAGASWNASFAGGPLNRGFLRASILLRKRKFVVERQICLPKERRSRALEAAFGKGRWRQHWPATRPWRVLKPSTLHPCPAIRFGPGWSKRHRLVNSTTPLCSAQRLQLGCRKAKKLNFAGRATPCHGCRRRPQGALEQIHVERRLHGCLGFPRSTHNRE